MPDEFLNFLEIQLSTAWRRTLTDFASFCAPSAGDTTLDIGCGPGLLPALFAGRGCQSIGADIDFRLLQAKLGPQLCQADAYKLPFPQDSFDMLTSTNVLFLLDKPVLALREWARTLKEGGVLCILNPSERLSAESARQTADERRLGGTAKDSLLNWAHNAETHFRWNERETTEMLESAGLILTESILTVGPGFARFCKARKPGNENL
jgi:ubiquinone/menaquinone biosynthesis C-methylase UbiE